MTSTTPSSLQPLLRSKTSSNVLFVCLVVLGTVQGLAQFLVINGRPRCFTVEVPKMTMLQIHYEAPDIETNPKSKTYAPTYITLLERPVETASSYAQDDDNDDREQQPNKLNRVKHKSRPVSQEITDHAGSFVQRIHEDSVVDVCVRASGAGQQTPMRFGLRTAELGDELTELEGEGGGGGGGGGNVEHHWTFLETQMDRIEHEMHTIISEADFFKERDGIYHQQTDALHQATLFWPMLHIAILLITGFTQANHIVGFFKAHRII